MTRNSYRRKVVRYRVNGAVNLAAHTNHWLDFVWQAGPWQVTATGRWGQIQVWASSEAEARRVIAHCFAIAGWPQPDVDAAEYGVREVTDPRVGKPGVCRVAVIPDGVAVTTREGPSGPPDFQVLESGP